MNNARNNARKFAENLKAKIPKGSGSGGGGGPNVNLPPASGTAVYVIAGLGLLGYAGYNSFYTVESGHRAILFNRIYGVQNIVHREGMKFLIPYIERPIIYDCRPKPRFIQSLTGSKDMQMVNITIRVLSKPDENNLQWIYRTLGQDYDERVLPSIVNEVTKAIVAKYNASELLTKREHVSQIISQELRRRALTFNILFDDVSIQHLTFSKEYSNAVEAKQVAQQDAERSKYIVQKAIQEKEATIIRAKGEAEAATLIGQSIKENPAFIKLRRLETARDIASTVSESGQKVYLDSNNLLLSLGERSSDDVMSKTKKKRFYFF